MIGQESRSNVCNLLQINYDCEPGAPVAGVAFTRFEVIDELLVAAGVPEDELEQWYVFSAPPPDIAIDKLDRFVAVNPKDILRRTSPPLVKGQPFSEAAASAVMDAVVLKVLAHQDKTAPKPAGFLKLLRDSFFYELPKARLSRRVREIKAAHPKIFTELGKTILPRY